MSSRSKNFRRRIDDDENDESIDRPTTTVTTTTKSSSKSTAAKPKKPTQQAPKLLSFVDDEDSETPSRSSSKPSNSNKSSSRLKPSASHKMITTKERIGPSSVSLPSNVQPQAGFYTKEALRELQKNTRTLASSSRPSSDTKMPSSEPIVLLKGLLKPVAETVKEAAELDDEGQEEMVRKDRDDAEARLASIGIGKGRDLDGDLIPDQATINAIRAKRERLRQSRAAAPDYISLDGGSNHGAAEGLSDEEPEFQGRIAMFGENMESGKKGVFEDVDERATGKDLGKDSDVDEEDEEEKIWEEEQFRKGLGKRMDDASGRVTASSVPVVQNAQQQKFAYPATVAYSSDPSVMAVPVAASIGGAYGASNVMDMKSIPQLSEVARTAFQDNLRRLKETHGRTMSSLVKTDENLSNSLLNITTLERSLSAAGEKFIFMQKLRDFVSVICAFLQDKAPFIEELEEQMQKLNEERASGILERRAADNDDELKEVEVAVNAAMLEFGKGGSSASLIAAAKSAAQVASAAMRDQINLPVKLDEFGRDTNLQRRMDMKRRADARQRRKARCDSKSTGSMERGSSYQSIEGESSTDESDSETTAYQSTRKSLLQIADQIFSDADEEYSQLSVVKEKFERWKRHYSSSYCDAYMSLSIPAIFSPYVRLELLKWDPLHEDAEFFDMKWHSLLFNFGLPEDGSDVAPGDADANLVPSLVERVALPILHHEITHCWDMLSTQETNNAVNATSLITNYVPASSEALEELLVAIRTRLAGAVTDITVPTWTPLVLKAVPNAARVAAYRFGTAVRLMRNICLWKEILALPILEKLALDELLHGKVLPHVRNISSDIHDAIKRTERIVASLSGVWSGPSVTGECSRKLQSLVDYILLLGKSLEKKRVAGAENEISGLARRLKKMLVELNEYDNARNIARTFHLKEAL